MPASPPIRPSAKILRRRTPGYISFGKAPQPGRRPGTRPLRRAFDGSGEIPPQRRMQYHSRMPDRPLANLADLKRAVREFALARRWEAYHTPKNLAMALIVEAAELVERFQWLTPEESLALDAARREQVRQEIADVLIYLTRLADLLDIDLLDAAAAKLAINARKYPVELARGHAAKYDELPHETR